MLKVILHSINLMDITGDKEEELFIFETTDSYVNKTISIKIYKIMIVL